MSEMLWKLPYLHLQLQLQWSHSVLRWHSQPGPAVDWRHPQGLLPVEAVSLDCGEPLEFWILGLGVTRKWEWLLCGPVCQRGLLVMSPMQVALRLLLLSQWDEDPPERVCELLSLGGRWYGHWDDWLVKLVQKDVWQLLQDHNVLKQKPVICVICLFLNIREGNTF